MIEPVIEDLRRWRLESGLRTGLVFPRSPTDLRSISYNTWAREVCAPAVRKALGDDAAKSPYHLRHSCVSMWIAEGHDVAKVAGWAGHTPQVCLDTYAHIFEDRDGDKPLDVCATVAAVRRMYAQGRSGAAGELPAGGGDAPAAGEAHRGF